MPEGSTGAFHVKVDLVEELGSDAFAYGTIAEPGAEGGSTPAPVTTRSSSASTRARPR